MKGCPELMSWFRLRALKLFEAKPVPQWGGWLNDIDYNDIYYYVRASDKQGATWNDVPSEVKDTFDRLGIPEAEKKYLGGVGAQFESEVIYHSLREDLQKQGVIFTDMDTAVRDYPDIVKKYFSTIIPAGDNKFASLNSAVWSGGRRASIAILSSNQSGSMLRMYARETIWLSLSPSRRRAWM